MEAYLRAFINFKQNNWVKLLSIVEFIYNNTKNASTNYTSFKLNYAYHPWELYKKEVDFHSKPSQQSNYQQN